LRYLRAARGRAFRGTLVVAANPGTEVSLAPELDLVKAALFYGDKVTLLSPVTTMLLRVEGLQRFSIRQQIEPIRRVAPVLMEPGQLPEFEEGLAKVDDFLRISLPEADRSGTSSFGPGLLQSTSSSTSRSLTSPGRRSGKGYSRPPRVLPDGALRR
jgi:hypothetical protein